MSMLNVDPLAFMLTVASTSSTRDLVVPGVDLDITGQTTTTLW